MFDLILCERVLPRVSLYPWLQSIPLTLPIEATVITFTQHATQRNYIHKYISPPLLLAPIYFNSLTSTFKKERWKLSLGPPSFWPYSEQSEDRKKNKLKHWHVTMGKTQMFFCLLCESSELDTVLAASCTVTLLFKSCLQHPIFFPVLLTTRCFIIKIAKSIGRKKRIDVPLFIFSQRELR